MKKPKGKLVILLMTLILSSCIFIDREDDIMPINNFTEQYEAVVITREAFENSTELLPAEPIIETGKIYVKDQFLFINQPNKGFHVFDNSNPSSPVNIVFLKVLGSTDISIKNDVLYINNATDLIAVKPNFNDNTIEITKRIANTFPELTAPNNCCYESHAEDEVIINWVLTEQ